MTTCDQMTQKGHFETEGTRRLLSTNNNTKHTPNMLGDFL